MPTTVNPRPTTGLTATSVNNFLVDAGAVYLNYGEATGERVLGATRGGNVFAVEQDIRLIEIDGIKGATKGARRVVESNARITARLMELSLENFLIALPGTTSTKTDSLGVAVGTTHDAIQRTREILSTDYIKNIAIVGKVQGTTQNFVGILYNALADSSFSIEQTARDEAVLEIQFTAHYDVNNITTEPWKILMPVVVIP